VSSYLKRWIDPALNKPEIANLSPSHAFLAIVLCLISMEIGAYLGEYVEEGPVRSRGMVLNLMVGGMLLINCLAYQFKWARSTTACLRGAAWVWMVAVFAAVIWVICYR
jgi:hypothetical protein